MPDTLTCKVTLNIHECPVCAIHYAIPVDFDHRKQRDGGSWYCPAGHSITYAKSEADKLTEQLAAERRRRQSAEAREVHAKDQAQAAEHRARAWKGQTTRLKNRAAAGVCPCCSRHFENVQRHMASKHPDFAA